MKKTLLAVLGLLCTASLAAGIASCSLLPVTPTPGPDTSSSANSSSSSSSSSGNNSNSSSSSSSSSNIEDSSSGSSSSGGSDSSSSGEEDSSSSSSEAEESTLSFETEGALVMEFDSTDNIAFETSFGTLAATKYTVEVSEGDIIDVTKGTGLVLISTKKAGVTELTIKAENKKTGEEVEATKTIIVKPRDMTIQEVKLGTSDIEGMFTLGGTTANKAATYDFDVSLGTAEDVSNNIANYIEWSSSSSSVKMDKNGVATLATSGETEIVTIQAKFVVDGEVYDDSNKYSFRCVYDAVNVSTYSELYAATKAEKAIVLNANIAFPTVLSEIKYDWMHTTYDDTYYKNSGAQDAAKIKTLLQFKNDLYGNGYMINAHNATLGLLDATGAPTENTLFKGPLNFVAMSDSGGMISVKAQDNVCFALFEGVTVNNVELRGADLKADNDGNVDLTDLNYAGTTVEVFGDNVNIEYCRINNGRTVLRVFGDYQDATKIINLNIKNSVLSNAREFIIRMGSNDFVDGTETNTSPFLGADNATSKEYYYSKVNNAYNNTYTSAQRKAYDEKYIKTFVTVKNSVFKDAGIFAIGIDSHFSGGALQNGSGFAKGLLTNWKDLAKTSYGAKLKFEGEVMMYNWKSLSQLDSSTLIEIVGESAYSDKMDFNVAEMVKAVADEPKFSSIVSKVNGEDWVHTGIAFFGGGKNYGAFENATTNELSSFEVSLAEVGKDHLILAAGDEPFHFLLSTDGSAFTPAEQERLLASEDAYACLKK